MSHYPVSEIFSSLQGEGVCMGQRHIFVRFAGCNLSCAYCDEAEKTHTLFSVDHIIEQIRYIVDRCGPHSFISLTGGEPLLCYEAIPALYDAFHHALPLYLETNGTLADAFRAVHSCVSMVAMDIKLPSVTGQPSFLEEHRAFMACALSSDVSLFVKMVVSPAVHRGEFAEAVQSIAALDPSIVLVLQPITTSAGVAFDTVYSELQVEALSQIRDVRIIPQVHKLLGVQ